MTTLQTLKESFKDTYLETYGEDIECALNNYEGNNDADDFTEWYTEEYIHSAEVIYYHTAIDLLRDNDPSLRDSLNLASDYGFELANLSSETLASLLVQSLMHDEIRAMGAELEAHFEHLEETQS